MVFFKVILMIKILFLGDDLRSKRASGFLNDNNKSITAAFLKNKSQLNEFSDVYIFPIPISLDGITLNNNTVKLILNDIIDKIPTDALVITGGKTIRKSVDIVNRDDFSYKNAVPTAEGAIALAMNSTDITLSESKILVTGFGRVSKILIKKLRGLCDDITVALRNKSDTALIETLGIKVIPIEKIAVNISSYNIIFNTIPYKIFDRETLSGADTNNLFIELASAQQGFDTTAINEFDLNYINAPGLPNKVAPKTAAYILAETIINILEEKNLI